jgi:hypothetical protein
MAIYAIILGPGDVTRSCRETIYSTYSTVYNIYILVYTTWERFVYGRRGGVVGLPVGPTFPHLSY